MIKICSLEFLNRNVFETDVMHEDGKIIFRSGDKITPEILLSLYFKEIYVKEWPLPVEFEQETEEAKQESEKMPEFGFVQPQETEEILEETDEFSIELKKQQPNLEFDENEAKKVSEYAIMMGMALHLQESQIKELETAAYYHNVGRIKLKPADLKEENFKKLQAEAGYSVLLTEMKFHEKIAEVARFYTRKYDSFSFKLNKDNPSDIPYYHIVSIANYYNNLVNKNIPKEQALKKMLQLGGNRFNIYVLHKFINLMRETNDEHKQQ